MEIIRASSQKAGKGPEDYFTGAVQLVPLFETPNPGRLFIANVTFDPGARTAWHTHPVGQTLIITSGSGWVQRWGSDKEEVHVGDVIWFAPAEKHWHGATATTAVTHISVVEKLDNSSAEWLEQVTPDQYLS